MLNTDNISIILDIQGGPKNLYKKFIEHLTKNAALILMYDLHAKS